MNDRRRLLSVLVIICLAFVSVVSTQESTCPSFVQEVLTKIGDDCAEMDRNEACYGSSRVDVTFWEAHDDITFSTPADRVPLLNIHTIATAPLNLDAKLWGVAVLHVQADVPDTLPGEAVTFLLMGDATLRNDVNPQTIDGIGDTPLVAIAESPANLRSSPTTTANVVGGLSAGDEILLIGTDEDAEWYEVSLEAGGSAWVWSQLIEVGDTSMLPITHGAKIGPRYGPMQAFYFTAGIGISDCHEAPDALVIRSPDGVWVNLRINNLNVTLGSTAIFTNIELPETNEKVMIALLLEGEMDLTTDTLGIEMENRGQFLALTLNENGLVDQNSRQIDIREFEGLPEATLAIVNNTCANLTAAELFEEDYGNCDIWMSRLVPGVEIVPPQRAATTGEALAGIKLDDDCTVAAFASASVRGGPGANYGVEGTLVDGLPLEPKGQNTDPDGYRWWKLPDNTWIRGDAVDTAGDCDSLPFAEAPPTTEPFVSDEPGDTVTLTFRNQCFRPNDVYISGPTSRLLYVVPNSTIQVQVKPGIYDVVATEPGNPSCANSGGVYGVDATTIGTFWTCPPNRYCD